MTIKTLPNFLGNMNLRMKHLQPLISILLIISLFVLTNCNSTEPVDTEGNNGGTPTTNTIAAKVNGTSIQTSLVTALVTNTGVPELSMVGIFSNANPPSSISINVDNPTVGTFDINDGLYSTDDESEYFVVNENEGSGSI